jgi:predicted nucleotide-binding protein (sugar kinase/HSP70/actin superfamily)
MKIAGATRYFCQQTDISGVIMVSSFGCGPDSLVNEYLEHHILRQSDKPYMVINIDEHTGNAGLITRVEAFWDMVIRRLNT